MFFRIQSKGSCFLVDGIPPEPKTVVASRGQFTQKEASSSSRYSTLLHPRTSNSPAGWPWERGFKGPSEFGVAVPVPPVPTQVCILDSAWTCHKPKFMLL